MDQHTVHLDKLIIAHLIKKLSSSIQAEASLPLTGTNIAFYQVSVE
jgi:hypothetical protein